MLPELAAAPKPRPAPASQPARAGGGVDKIRELLSFAPPKFDPRAVTSARAQLEAAMTKPTGSEPRGGVGAATAGFPDRAHGLGYGAYGPGTKPGADLPEISSAKDQLALALRNQRANAIGADDSATDANDKPERMTPAEYEALSPRQRQAVDFNTQLVRAVHRDRKNSDAYVHTSEEQRDKYDKAVSGIFGKDRGSEKYAPETVALLQRMGFDDPNADLDDFLSLKAGIHDTDLPKLAGPEPTVKAAMVRPAATPDTPEADRLALSQMLAAKSGLLEKAIASSQPVLQTMNATVSADLADLVKSYGGEPKVPAAQPGFGTSPLDADFQRAFEMLGDKSIDPAQVMGAVQSQYPDQLDAFLAYAGTRLENSTRYGQPVNSHEGVKVRTPEEFRQLLGTDGGN